jgi:hypothetical protein
VPAGTDWPNVAAALLGLVAVIEALAWGYRSGSLLLILLLALASTIPVVLVQIQPALAVALITGATVLTTIAFGRPLVAALGALVISLSALARNRSRVAALLLVALLLGYAGITGSGTDRTGRLPRYFVAASPRPRSWRGSPSAPAPRPYAGRRIARTYRTRSWHTPRVANGHVSPESCTMW